MLKKIKSKIGNKDAKVLIGNFISLSILQLLNFIFPIITLPYLSKVIGVEKFGILAFANAIIIFFYTFTEYGFNYTAVRDVSKNRENHIVVSKIFNTVLFSRIILMLISLVILLSLFIFSSKIQEYQTVILLTFLTVPGYILFPEWFFQAMEKMKYITIINVLSKTIFTALIFVVVRKESDFIYVPLLTAAGFILSGSIAIYYVYFKFNIKFCFPGFKEIRSTIKSSTSMFISLILPNLYTSLSIIFLQTFWGKSATGIFDGGNKFIALSQQITNILSRTFYPFLARRIDKHRLYEIISFSTSILISLCLFFGASIIVKFFYTDEFLDAVIVLKILAFSPIFLFMMNAYGTNYLVLINKESVLRNIIICCSFFGLLLSYILISKYSFIGAATSIVSVWIIRGLVTWFYASRFKKQIRLENSETGSSL